MLKGQHAAGAMVIHKHEHSDTGRVLAKVTRLGPSRAVHLGWQG